MVDAIVVTWRSWVRDLSENQTRSFFSSFFLQFVFICRLAHVRKFFGSLFGALLHATKYRPEIMAALGLLGSCLPNPTQELYNIHLLRVLVYLARTRSLGVTYTQSTPTTRASYARSPTATGQSLARPLGIRSCWRAPALGQSRGGNTLCISMSSYEAELNALAECAIELASTSPPCSRTSGTCRTPPSSVSPTTRLPTTSAIESHFTSAQNSRHIDRKMFKMRELRGAGVVTVAHVGTEHNPADLFTKILSRQPFEKHPKTVLNLPGDTGVEHGVRTRMAKTRPLGLPAG